MTELVPTQTLQAAIQYANELSKSGLLPRVYQEKPANVLWAMEYARTLGISHMAAITGIHVIDGKPTASSALISALVRRAGHKLRISGTETSATVQIIRSDDPDWTFTATWTLDRAKTAGLLGKQVWKNYPAAMLKARAITECARDACQEALFGVQYTAEELGAEVDEDGNVIEGTLIGEPVSAPPAPTADPAAQKLADAAMFAECKGDITTLWREAGREVLGRHVTNTAITDPAQRAAAPLMFLGDVLKARGEILPDTIDETAATDAPSATEGDANPLPDTDNARALTEAAAATWDTIDATTDATDDGGQEPLL